MPIDEAKVAEVLEANDGELTDEQMADLLDGNEVEAAGAGDTDGDKPTSEPEETPTGEADQETTSPTDNPEEDPTGDQDSKGGEDGGEQEPTLLAKDGEHTIPYQKLVDARDEAKDAKDQAKNWQEIAEGKDKLIDDLKSQAADPASESTDDPDESGQEAQADKLATDMEELLEDYPEAAKHIKGIMDSNSSLTQKISDLETAIESLNPVSPTNQHFAQIKDAHADHEEIPTSEEFTKWLDGQPSIMKNAYSKVLQEGTAEQVIEMFDTYKQAIPGDTGKESDTQKDTGPTDAEKVAAAEHKAKDDAAAPTSLSDIPGSTAHHDEGEAMRDMSAMSLLDKFDGKSQEQIEELLQRAL